MSNSPQAHLNAGNADRLVGSFNAKQTLGVPRTCHSASCEMPPLLFSRFTNCE
ncbi:MAG: hypothetical protein WC637_11705 [Victivallales bacterium]